MIERAVNGPSDAAQDSRNSGFAIEPPLRTGGLFLDLCRAARKLLTVPFKSMFLGAAGVPDEASLAAQRCSNFLCM